ncbi:MAG: Holliday junction branch migration protein RuvA [Planctomycetota bacterium]
MTGRLVSAEPSRAVVECGGVGYLVRVPLTTFDRLPPPGEECRLLTHLHVREDAMELFGFAEEAERSMFRRLIAVSGVGPGVAMALMSGNSVADIIAAVRRGDAKLLMRAKGVGRKTAERIVLELKGVVEDLEALVSAEAGPAPAAAPEATAVQALVTLGYSEGGAAEAVREVLDELGPDAPLGDVIREALGRVR